MNDFSLRPRPALRSFPREGSLPLSPAQLRVWLLNQAGLEDQTSNVVVKIHISGSLDVAALEAALGDVIARHEILRTIFPAVESIPCQLINPDRAGWRMDLAGAGGDESLGPGIQRKFDLRSETPLRAFLIASCPCEFVLVLVVHRIAFDAWSVLPLVEDLSRAYTARSAGTAPEFSKLPVQYADYTRWQQRMLGYRSDPQSSISRQQAFWTRALQGLPDQISLSIERPLSTIPTNSVETAPIFLDHSLHSRLLAFARQHRTNMFMVLHAAFAALLDGLGAGVDVPIATVVSGRSHGALHQLVGLFSNTLMLRTDTSGNPTFSDLLSRVRLTVLTAHAYQDLPVEYLGKLPFQFFLVVRNAPAPRIRFEGAHATIDPVRCSPVTFDLMFELDEPSPGKTGIEGRILYRPYLYRRESMEEIFQNWLSLLDDAVNDPDRSIQGLELERRTF